MRDITKIVVHCTDSPDHLDFGVKTIDGWHKERGWTGIGYHYVIRRNGTIERGRPNEKVGAHVFGHNRNSLGLVWVGRNSPTQRQQNILIDLLFSLMVQYGLSVDNVYGHNELDDKKTCPNINMDKIRAELVFKRDDKLCVRGD